MTIEQIEKAAEEMMPYSKDESSAGRSVFGKHYKRGFRAGAQWRINSVWHAISDMPQQGEYIVVVMKNGCFTSWFVTPDIAQIFKKFNVILWAYSKDLLPERKEVKE